MGGFTQCFYPRLWRLPGNKENHLEYFCIFENIFIFLGSILQCSDHRGRANLCINCRIYRYYPQEKTEKGKIWRRRQWGGILGGEFYSSWQSNWDSWTSSDTEEGKARLARQTCSFEKFWRWVNDFFTVYFLFISFHYFIFYIIFFQQHKTLCIIIIFLKVWFIQMDPRTGVLIRG